MTEASSQSSGGSLAQIVQGAIDLSAEFDDVTVTGEDLTRDEVAVRIYALGALAAARELASGVLREVEAGAPANAVRLARHAFEQSLDLQYLSENPDAAIRQFEAREAKSRLAMERADEESQLPSEWADELRQMTKAAQRLDGKARTRPPEEVLAIERGTVNYEQKAQAIGRTAEYETFYAGASWVSHPGVIASENHLIVDEDLGSARIRRSGSNPALSQTALSLCLLSLVGVLESADGLLGPLPQLKGRLAALKKRGIDDVSFGPQV